MGNVNMEASQIHYRGGNRPMSVEEALKEGSSGASNASIAPEFSETAQYMPGDFVFYEGTLYRFEEEHAAGAWDSTQVMGTNISENMVMLPGDGLQRIIHEFAVKLKADGGLHFDANGAIYADHLPDYRLIEHKTGQTWIDGKDVYMKVYTNIQLSSNTDVTVDNDFVHDAIVRITATVKDVSGADTYVTPFQSFGTLNSVGAIPRVVNNRVSINCVGTVTGTATIIIEYTIPTE